MRTAGCLLTILSLLAFLGLTAVSVVPLVLSSFNDSGDPSSAAALSRAHSVIVGLQVGMVALGILGVVLTSRPAKRGRPQGDVLTATHQEDRKHP